MSSLNLEPLRKFKENQMTDFIVIRYASSGVGNATWNDATGSYTASTAPIVYAGPCSVTSQGWQPIDTNRGGGELIVSRYEIAIPISARKISKDSSGTVTRSFRNPNLVGVTMVVADRLDVSNAICQKLLAEKRMLRRTR